MHRDFEDLLSALNDETVRYLVVGGYAVSLHAQPRATKDLDILVRPDATNAAALFRALVTFGAPLAGVEPGDLVQPGSFYRMGAPPVIVGILPKISGIDFDEAWARRHLARAEPESQVEAYFMSVDDLIAAKPAAGRAQDLADVEALREAARKRQEGRRQPPRSLPR